MSQQDRHKLTLRLPMVNLRAIYRARKEVGHGEAAKIG
jgi:hypothetical protein